MDEWTEEWNHGCMVEFMGGERMDRWMREQMNGMMHTWMSACVGDGLMNGWIHKWMNEWTNGWIDE